eukprot:706492-Hanusia_phi.AAC.7
MPHPAGRAIENVGSVGLDVGVDGCDRLVGGEEEAADGRAIPADLKDVLAGPQMVRSQDIPRLEGLVLVEVVLQLVHRRPISQEICTVPPVPALIAHADIPFETSAMAVAFDRTVRINFVRVERGQHEKKEALAPPRFDRHGFFQANLTEPAVVETL